LVEGSNPGIEVAVRLQQAVERQVLGATGEPVEALTVTGRHHRRGEEAIEHEILIPTLPSRAAVVKAAGSERGDLMEAATVAGTLLWRWEPLHVTAEAWVDEIEEGLRRVRVRVSNRLEWAGGAREQTLMQTPRGVYLVLHTPDGAFVSLAAPPPALRAEAEACHNEGLWPVPVGEAGDRRTVLASPIRLEDYPRLASEGLADLPGRGIAPAAQL
jgi:hypothetical protein